MPTGYTCNIHKGITFQEYALTCARAFGATIELRDEPLDKEIPEKFQPHTYHKRALQKARDTLVHLCSLLSSYTDEAAEKEYAEAMERHKGYLKEKANLKIKYLAMEAQVRAYIPPTADHEGLKRFMLEQLETSSGDYSTDYMREPVKQSGAEWIASKLQSCYSDIAYHEGQWADEQTRCARNNLWVKQLRESL